MTKPIRILDVKPRIPERLKPLYELGYNLYFAWHHDADELFKRIDSDRWTKTKKNPIAFLGGLRQSELTELLEDEGFLSHMDRVKGEFDRYMSEKPDKKIFGEESPPFFAAYFTAECGVADCLRVYSGGLGILSGDHLKSSSDLNLPLVGISLAYQEGYFTQSLTHDGWQMETYPANKFTAMPMKRVLDESGNALKVAVDLKGEMVHVQAWEVHVGRTVLYLLDTNMEENSERGRIITSRLYGGDREMRISQEIVLGVGGVKLLKAVGLEPAVYHMNEGHSAFAVFERIRELREDQGLNFNEALEYVRGTSVFTTHTPVPAGNDTFHPDLVRQYLGSFTQPLGISMDVLLGFGRQDPRDREEEFCMTVLALRLSNWHNGVSRLHSEVSRKMWHRVWPKTPQIDLPITYITNGVHIPSWISKGMGENYVRYLGPRWIEDPENASVWDNVARIPNSELWRTHERARERLISFTRNRLKEQLASRGASNRDMAIADEVLDPESLTIGFARRFAPYKRADLILRDLPRFEHLLLNKEFPVQIIFAGKAHPQDQMGKDLIKKLVQTSGRDNLRRHMVFLEDYDMEVARHMVQGVDVWLNTPRRPLEACGTSGMKAVANGALHLSVLDGWWDEGYDSAIGWAFGAVESMEDHEFQDQIDSSVLYDILEKDVAPLFYDRGPDGLPRGWLAMMKASLHKLCPMFTSHRMVLEYWKRFYVPSAERQYNFRKDSWKGIRKLGSWRDKIMFNWDNVSIKDIRFDDISEIEMGAVYHAEVDVFIGQLAPEDIVVEAYCGSLDPSNNYQHSFAVPMIPVKSGENRVSTYQCDIPFEETGHYGLNVRITPNHPDKESRLTMGLVIWGED